LQKKKILSSLRLRTTTGKKNAADARGHQPQLHTASPLLEAAIPFDSPKPSPVMYLYYLRTPLTFQGLLKLMDGAQQNMKLLSSQLQLE